MQEDTSLIRRKMGEGGGSQGKAVEDTNGLKFA